jgi:hypothetical protein
MIDTRRLVLKESGQLKLAAVALLAEGGKNARFEASVLYHAAARAERRALDATDQPTHSDRLRSAVEICGCLIDGLDPSAVFERAWGQVLDISAALPEAEALAIRSRLDPQLSAFLRKYQRSLKSAPSAASAMKQGRALERDADVSRLLEVFPGDPRFWASRALLLIRQGRSASAWDYIQRARRLDPEDTTFRQAELGIVVEARPKQAASILDAAYREIMLGGNADLCIGFVSGATKLGAQQSERAWFQRGFDIATLGMSYPPLHSDDRAWFNAFRLILRELLQGKKPGIDILYRAGLGSWVMSWGQKSQDPIEVLLKGSAALRAA